MYKSPLISIGRAIGGLLILLIVFLGSGCSTLQTSYFTLQFVDSETGRGIPLVEVETTNRVRLVSDSTGRIAIAPDDLGSRSIFFYVHSHGYEMPESDQGSQGVNVVLVPGRAQIVTLDRVNIAERLYRVTGEGIYHDSQLVNAHTPLPYETRPKGGVFGQDSVVNAAYKDKLYWFWGDTKRGDSPLGNFKVSGAVSPLPGDSIYKPAEGVNLSYFVGKDGFVRQMLPLVGDGMVWINGVLVVEDSNQEYLLSGYSRMNVNFGREEQGIAKWNDQKQKFEKLIDIPLNTPFALRGHPVKITTAGEEWFYFGQAIPDIRVRADLKDVLNLKRYQAYSPLRPGSRWNDAIPPLDRDAEGNLVWDWKYDTDVMTTSRWSTLQEKGLLRAQDGFYGFRDIETGDQVIPHSGSLTWNEYRQRWILIFGQAWGTTSFLGEVWYAEALKPEGPWTEARKIVTHDRYSFYNVKQHPYFAEGSYIYFEGTYTQSFSGNDQATPRYDYNQIMYRLNLDDPRLPHASTTMQPKTKTASQL
ncbi:MAG: hypothetical protein R3E64_06210 [Halioglobus sp.]